MRYRDLAKIAEKNGWKVLRQGKGSHVIWIHPKASSVLPIPNHGSKELNPKLTKALLKVITENTHET